MLLKKSGSGVRLVFVVYLFSLFFLCGIFEVFNTLADTGTDFRELSRSENYDDNYQNDQ